MMEGAGIRADGRFGSLSASPTTHASLDVASPLLRSPSRLTPVAILRRHRHVLVLSACMVLAILVWAGIPSNVPDRRVRAVETTARSAARSDPRVMLYVGTYTKDMGWIHGRGQGIHLFELDPHDGSLHPQGVAIAGPNPTFVTGIRIDRRHVLYAVSEVADVSMSGSLSTTGYVYALAVGNMGVLSIMNRMETGGARPCHLAISPQHDYLVASNYDGGSVTVFPLNTYGSLLPPTDFHAFTGASHVDPIRQDAAHVHSTTWHNNAAGNAMAFTADLGNDRIVQFELDAASGKLVPNAAVPFIARPPGSGPRGVLLHPTLPIAYILDELSSTIGVYQVDPSSGSLGPSVQQTISTLPKEFDGASTAGALQISENAAFLYVSNLGHDSIAMFRIGSMDGQLQSLGHAPSGGKAPRALLVYHEWLVVANQASNNLQVFAIEPQHGTLQAMNKSTYCGSPAGLFIAP